MDPAMMASSSSSLPRQQQLLPQRQAALCRGIRDKGFKR